VAAESRTEAVPIVAAPIAAESPTAAVHIVAVHIAEPQCIEVERSFDGGQL
jgi:hypothetical protein